MLQLKNIKKKYVMGDLTVDALKGVSLNFRKSDFVSILGPSGCGKTTLLNIVGGLDNYTDGDLVINGKSTKRYNDRDWDTYRNHSIGFVFQSYNLIPHQTALQNVELALALSGISKAERNKRAKKALDEVGLQGMYNKRPNQMSGGQMQRVAIARAIVNNPEIVLADEPTGALDTETSVQVMDILKKISKDRLVIMVTHNPELAEKYSTRIVRMLDGLITEDSCPYSDSQLQQDLAQQPTEPSKKPVKKPSMSFATSFGLSLKNLFTKLGRTILTSFAGSIGIIGIALIFAVSNGMTTYIDLVQEDTLSSYPLVLEQSHTDISGMFQSLSDSAQSQQPHDKDAVYEKLALYNLTNALGNIKTTQNDLASYKKHLEEQLADEHSQMYKGLNGVHYSYNLDLQIYTKNGDGNVILSDTSEIMADVLGGFYGIDMSTITTTGSSMMSAMMSSAGSMSMWQELLPAKDGGLVNDILKRQYDVVYGNWPNAYNEVVLVVDGNNEIDDLTLYALGLKTRAEIDQIIDAAQSGATLPQTTQKVWTYQQICSKQYKTIFNYECYSPLGDGWYDKRQVDGELQRMFEDSNVGLDLKVVGIIRPADNGTTPMLSGSICYTTALTNYVIEQSQNSDIATAQKQSPNVDVFTGLYFKDNKLTDQQKIDLFKDYTSSASSAKRVEMFTTIASIPTAEEIAQTEQSLKAMPKEQLKQLLVQALQSSSGGATSEQIADAINKMTDEQLEDIIPTIAPGMAQATKLGAITRQLMAMTPEEQKVFIDMAFASYTDEQCVEYFDSVMPFSDSTYQDNLVKIGCLDIGAPSAISLYTVSFSAKDVVEEDIANYNKNLSDADKIKYNDYVGLIMSSVTTIIDAITYVLIAFVSISLIVSSIMIGVITLISVQERTKEIGILRALGASKRNVSTMFNAETVIIGLVSGLFGVGFTYLLTIPINLILHALTGIQSLNAILPIAVAGVLVAISVLLTLIAGIIPSRSAAKKDPVVALRTE